MSSGFRIIEEDGLNLKQNKTIYSANWTKRSKISTNDKKDMPTNKPKLPPILLNNKYKSQ